MERRAQFLGWLFSLWGCALFVTSSMVAHDAWGTVASVMFLVGCLVFLGPFVLRKREHS